ncbi:hypothetical protein [Pseudoduganella sp. RAF53_2]|jgi:hypothetical protein|uniref:hypothetical protein n=1 Tax=unclassified Pseudoduganella TaxID=2637179 RepID=UPI003F9AA7C7
MNKFLAYALFVTLFSSGTSWVRMFSGPSATGGGSSWSSSSGSWGGGGYYGGSGGGGGGGHK